MSRYTAPPAPATRQARGLLVRLALTLAIIFLFAVLSRAGGPAHIAGTSYFDSNMAGQPLTWPQGTITYFTDQGDLSPILPNASANALVANMFAQWTSINTAAIAASSGGQLVEDVNGSNVYLNSDGTISMPADIQPSATSTPVGDIAEYKSLLRVFGDHLSNIPVSATKAATGHLLGGTGALEAIFT